MSKLKCIVIEDEPLAVKILSDYIAQIPLLELVCVFRDALQATPYLTAQRIDLIFLDIHLPRLKGIDFLKTLPQPPSVIITTAYHQYAIDGFNLNVSDYLLKPFGFERFVQAIHKVANQRHVSVPARDFMFLTVQKKKVKVYFEEILFIESQREYIKIVSNNRELLTKMSTHEICGLLPDAQFKRVHRSFVVAIDKIESYTADTLEIKGIPIPVGREYRSVLEIL
jgi:two-component system, LytTR family, response regulator